MDTKRTDAWVVAVAVAALVLALAALVVTLNRGSHGAGMMGGGGYRGNYGPGMMNDDRDDYGPGMMGRRGTCFTRTEDEPRPSRSPGSCT